MNPFLLSGDERVKHWKQFRDSLSDLSDIEKMTKIAEYWSKAPLINHAYDCDAPDTWLTIWEMIKIGDWCRNSIAIGMDHTLRLVNFAPSRLIIGTIIDYQNSVSNTVVQIDNEWLLNYNFASITPRPKRLVWLKQFRWTGKKYFEINE